VRVIYLFIIKSYSKYSDKKEKTRNTLVNAKCPLGMPEGHVTLYADLSSNSGVLGNGCLIHCINKFLCYRSTFKRRALLS